MSSTANHRRPSMRMRTLRSFFPCLPKKSFVKLNENDVYWSEEPLVHHADAEDKKIATGASFPCGMTSMTSQTPATVVSSPCDDSTCWATFNNNKDKVNELIESDETDWFDTTANGANNIFSAEKVQQQPAAATSVADIISEVNNASSEPDDDVFFDNCASIRDEPNRRLFGPDVPTEKKNTGNDMSTERQFTSPTSAMDFPADTPEVSTPPITSDVADEKVNEMLESFKIVREVKKGLRAKHKHTLSPSKRDTLHKTRSSSPRHHKSKDALLDIVCTISKKCSDLQRSLEEKESDIEKLRLTHDALIRDLEQRSTCSIRSHNITENKATSNRGAFDRDEVAKKKVLSITLAANAKLEKALKVMQENANAAKKSLDRTIKDHEIEVRQLQKHHENVLNEQREAYSKAFRGMHEQQASMAQQIQELKSEKHDLELHLECTKSSLHEEAALRAQENLNHVYELMDLTRDHEIRVADLKKERSNLQEQVEEGHLKIEELKMSIELVKADAEYASAKLERTTKKHRDEVRTLTKESDDRFFMMMAAREQECDGLSQKLKGMFDAEKKFSGGKQRSTKFD